MLNSEVGLDEVHLGFLGTEKDYWDRGVKYKRTVRASSNLEGYGGVAKRTTLERRREDR